jgi:hypothetical protein
MSVEQDDRRETWLFRRLLLLGIVPDSRLHRPGAERF